MLKRLTRSSAFQALLSWLAANYIRFVYVTSRWREEGRAPANELMQSGRPYIAAFWHGRLLMAPTGWRSRAPLSVMISQHRDGEMIARTVHHFGVHTVRGSTTRGGSKALRELLVVVRNGCWRGFPARPSFPRPTRSHAARSHRAGTVSSLRSRSAAASICGARRSMSPAMPMMMPWRPRGWIWKSASTRLPNPPIAAWG